MRQLYTFLLYCLTPFAVLRLWWKSRQNPAYRQRIAERFAYHLPDKPFKPPLWIHAVSVGEFLAIKPLLEYLLTTHPDLVLWITSTTPTGSAQIQQFAHSHRPRVIHSYFPYDTPAILRRFIAHVQPRGIVLMETEIWPNLLTIAQQQNIPVVLTNARLSAKSLRGYYQYARAILKQSLPSLLINAQTRDDAWRFRKLGARADRVSVTPNLKYHHSKTSSPDWMQECQLTFSKFDFVWLAASTHAGEDEIIITAHRQLQANIPNALLMIAPRHPERREEIEKHIKQAGFNAKLRSQDGAITSANDLYLIDTLGELKHFFTLAQAAFIGGSLINHGGHNPLEALQAGIPVCFGPSMFNFKAIAASLADKPFAQTVSDANALSSTLLDFYQANLTAPITQFNRQHENILMRHYQYLAAHLPLD